jgi:hypothetical protein
MAGIGTTLVEAMLLGMDAVGIEFEQRFVDQTNRNIECARKLFPNSNLGRAVCVRGDARDLSYLNTQRVKSVVFSPPYFDAMKNRASSETEAMEKHLSSVRHAKRIGGRPISKAPARSNLGYGVSDDNIGNIQKFGSIIFSPPYFDALSLNKGGGSKNSALYEETTKDLQMKRSGPFAVAKNLPTPYSTKKANIGNIVEFGSIIFSPPYEAALNASKHVGGIVSRDPQLAKTSLYSKDKNNIGNAVGQTYLGEMLKVYHECYRVLRPGKFMVVVVKDIQRKWKTVPLGAETIRLCQVAGFNCHDVIINKMYFPSFWMLSLAKKSQKEGLREARKFHALKNHEYVLVFRKPE